MRPGPVAFVAAAAILDLDALTMRDDLHERCRERKRRARPIFRPVLEQPVPLDEPDDVLDADAVVVQVPVP